MRCLTESEFTVTVLMLILISKPISYFFSKADVLIELNFVLIGRMICMAVINLMAAHKFNQRI